MEVIKAVIGRMRANRGPKSPHEKTIESILVSGAQINKERILSRLAFFSFNPRATGIAEQEQMGRGRPKSAAYSALLRLFSPRYSLILSTGIMTTIQPTNTSPIMMKGAVWVKIERRRVGKSFVNNF